MRAGKPVPCCTPATEVDAQLCGGGIDGYFPVLLTFDFENKVAVKRWDGILAYHDFEFREDGAITAWKSYGIGRGKRTSKADLDKLYEVGTMPSSENTTPTFAQGTTGATFAEDVGKSVETCKPKIELSGGRKHKLKAEKAETTEAREVARKKKSEAAQVALDKVVTSRAPFQCIGCDRRFARGDCRVGIEEGLSDGSTEMCWNYGWSRRVDFLPSGIARYPF
jgi:hypothetical protein